MVKQARHLVETGELGEVRKVVAEYSQGWLASKDDEGGKQAAWRLDPAKSWGQLLRRAISAYMPQIWWNTSASQISANYVQIWAA